VSRRARPPWFAVLDDAQQHMAHARLPELQAAIEAHDAPRVAELLSTWCKYMGSAPLTRERVLSLRRWTVSVRRLLDTIEGPLLDAVAAQFPPDDTEH